MVNSTTLDFAAFGSALEKMECLIVFSVDLDIALEEAINRQAPGFLHVFCSTSGSAPVIDPMEG